MENMNLIEDYFVKINKSCGISKLDYSQRKLDLDDKFLKKIIFISEDFNQEYDNLLEYCELVYKQLK